MTSNREHQNSTFSSRFTKVWLTVGGLLLVGLVAGIGSFLGTRFTAEQNTAQLPIELRAATASNSDSLSLATGLITEEVEGLWLLDHESGRLQCWVMSPRSGAISGIFATNVANDLESSKGEPKMVMATGNFFFFGGRVGKTAPAKSICYVANTTTGIVAGYSARVNPTMIDRGQMQTGELIRVCSGKIKEQMAVRDQ